MKIIIFILSLLITPQVFANPLFSDDNSKVVVTNLPIPTQLQTGWWQYFEDTQETENLQKAQASYAKLLEQLPENLKPQAEEDFKRFLLNLKAYNKQKDTKEAEQSVEAIVYKDNYNIDEWLKIAMQLHTLEILLEQQTLLVKQESSALNTAQKELEELMLKYIETDITNVDKITLGFEIMADRAAIAVTQLQLKLNKSKLLQQQHNIQQQKELNSIALSRLKADEKFIEQHQLELTELSKKQSLINKTLESGLPHNIGVINNTVFSQITAQVQKQKVINLKLEENDIALQLASLEAQKELMNLLQQITTDFKTLNSHLLKWREDEKNAANNIAIWRNDTLQQASQAQRLMVSLSGESEISPKVRKLLDQQLKLTLEAQLNLKKIQTNRQILNTLLDELENRIAQQTNKIDFLFNWSSKQLEDLSNSIITWWKKPLFTIGDTPVTALGLLRVVFIIIMASLVSWFFRRVLLHIAEKDGEENANASALYTVGRLAHYVILLIGIIIALSSIGLDFTNLALVAGALSVGIGFGLQSIVNNFVSGLILLFERSAKVGDFIELDSGLMGVIKEINVRSTLINTTDNIDIIVPNSLLVSEKVTNWTLREATRRIHVPFGVAYGTDKELVKKAVLEAADRVPFTHKLKKGDSTQCWLVGFGDSSLNFELIVWVNKEAVRRPSTVHAAYTWEIETSLRQYNIEIPFPQRDLHIRSGLL